MFLSNIMPPLSSKFTSNSRKTLWPKLLNRPKIQGTKWQMESVYKDGCFSDILPCGGVTGCRNTAAAAAAAAASQKVGQAGTGQCPETTWRSENNIHHYSPDSKKMSSKVFLLFCLTSTFINCQIYSLEDFVKWYVPIPPSPVGPISCMSWLWLMLPRRLCRPPSPLQRQEHVTSSIRKISQHVSGSYTVNQAGDVSICYLQRYGEKQYLHPTAPSI